MTLLLKMNLERNIELNLQLPKWAIHWEKEQFYTQTFWAANILKIDGYVSMLFLRVYFWLQIFNYASIVQMVQYIA